jgi:rare lipoprotein A
MRLAPRQLIVLALAALLAACSSTKPTRTSSSGAKGGGYYQDDGPADSIPAGLDRVPDAVPRVEPYASGPNKPYSVFGHEYVPDLSDRPFSEQGIGSWYGRKFNGQRTSSGETYDMFAMTAAHPTLPIPSYAKVTNPANGRSVIVRINDRGPFHPGRVIDLSYAAAYRLGYVGSGSAPVQVDRILPADIRAGRIPNAQPMPSAPLFASAAPAARAPLPTPALPPVVTPVLPPAALPQAAEAPPVFAESELPRDLMPTEVALAPSPGVTVAAAASAGVVSSSSDTVFVQLAAFRVKTGADDFMAHMSGELDADLVQRLRVVSGGDVYRVQLGPYLSRSDAMAAADRLRADLGISPMLVNPH